MLTAESAYMVKASDVNKDWTHKDQDKDQDKDKDCLLYTSPSPRD